MSADAFRFFAAGKLTDALHALDVALQGNPGSATLLRRALSNFLI